MLTQVRIPQFNTEDEETEPFQMSPTVSTATQEITITPRTKRRQQSTESYTNVENTNIEKKRIQARERMAAKRAEATPEEAERQRILAMETSAARRAICTPEQAERERALARERSASRRVAMTSEEIEQQRALSRERNASRRAALTPKEVEEQRTRARERSAARRAALTPEEIEQQRVLARERSAARRAALTPGKIERQRSLTRERNAATRVTLTSEEVEQQRTCARERSAARRAALTPEEIERQRSLARERSAARRAALTPEEIERQRSLTRERNAATRATLTPKEVEQQRQLAVERTMVIRATASPKVAEEQRVLACKRSATRRANYTTEEAEQQRALARKRSRLQSNMMQKQVAKKKETSRNAEVEWPKPANMECKTSCLKKFIQQMSMNSLAEGLPDDDVPECLWATMQVSTNVEASESERASYIPDLLLNASEYNNTAAVSLIPSAVLDVNGTNISSDDVAEHLLERMKAQITDKTRETDLEEHAPEDPVSTCMDVKTCSAKGGKSQPGICSGPSNVQCCKLGSGKPKPVNTMLTNLADILRRAGLRVIEQPGWKTRGHGKMASVKSILIHHTAGPSKGEYPSLGVVRDGRKDLPGPLAQLGLGRSGTWYVIAAGRCYHAGKTINDSIFGNSNSIGIEAEGTGTPPDNTGHRYWPPVQWKSYVRGVKALQAAYGVPTARVLGHKEAAVPKGRKVDPNFSMTEFRAALR
ncbi:unnamed protein product [Rotaria sordida]|uniref:N-acetylmuramoyl-L-alanine amidase domain-containing protein n=3 Tax=Rotaria sordida TaxID=392033 RepID=A0A814X8T6_9BILA|nr:unnamed protein product [Rotaria sordida]